MKIACFICGKDMGQAPPGFGRRDVVYCRGCYDRHHCTRCRQRTKHLHPGEVLCRRCWSSRAVHPSPQPLKPHPFTS